MSQDVFINPNPTVSKDEAYVSPPISVPNTGVETTLVKMVTRVGVRSYMTLLAAQIDPGGQGFTTFRLYRNGIPWYPYDSQLNQWSDPTLSVRLPYREAVDQGVELKITATCTGASSGPFNATARLIIENESQY